ncbi:unnamed protein product [Parnassius apollo]|uniref:(apollo) hypothetical protein n=1 Tax=Parnassius apollo TaxID=110799 RepID=A0A8S3X7Z7_PARAO|nr:unnamed protein product [Parnassius apollo]
MEDLQPSADEPLSVNCDCDDEDRAWLSTTENLDLDWPQYHPYLACSFCMAMCQCPQCVLVTYRAVVPTRVSEMEDLQPSADEPLSVNCDCDDEDRAWLSTTENLDLDWPQYRPYLACSFCMAMCQCPQCVLVTYRGFYQCFSKR